MYHEHKLHEVKECAAKKHTRGEDDVCRSPDESEGCDSERAQKGQGNDDLLVGEPALGHKAVEVALHKCKPWLCVYLHEALSIVGNASGLTVVQVCSMLMIEVHVQSQADTVLQYRYLSCNPTVETCICNSAATSVPGVPTHKQCITALCAD